MHGISSSAVDFAKWLKEASDVINPIVISFNAFEAANKANNTEEFIQGFSDIRCRLLAKLADQTPQMRKKKAKIKQQTTPSNIYDYAAEPYVPAANLPPIAGSNRVHKRVHPDGKQPSPTDKYGDPYTLQADGKPLGAKAGVMPNEHKGLKKLTPDQISKIENENFPDLRIKDEFRNFSSLEPKTLKPGDTVYRIIDEKANPAGGYWATELPKNKTEWRSNYAVKDSWNDNGYYVKHTVPEGEEIKVWQGKTAGQKYKEHDGKQFYLEGGNEQIFMEPGTLKAEGLAPQQTHWPEV